MNNQTEEKMFTAEQVLKLIDENTVNSYETGIRYSAELLIIASERATDYAKILNDIAKTLLDSITTQEEEEDEEEESA
jgi:hypothetical protein